MSKLILIRGNSASGKTTLANQLQEHFGTAQCLLLHQDVLRRELLHANDHVGSPAIELIADLLAFGARHYPIVILEGILRRDVYGAMLTQASQYFDATSLTYYLDIPFELTWQRNLLKTSPFTMDQLKSWWLLNDQLTENDRLLTALTTANNLTTILSDWQQNN
ncbi:AAA family ATPase [Lapidilactobacillus wuchangensis]|uniref:AAA family ATPase n=1 Tax=Lapidilactobacillus wuchangensis TaxID=2486001 RepID=UPI000F7A5246|nr:AAA family ATPase [Lapidilactobacillus wuchangensis]